MKKNTWKMLLIAIAGIVMVILGLSGVTSSQGEQISDLMLENIEALAGGEDSTTVFCYGEGSLHCPDGTKVEL